MIDPDKLKDLSPYLNAFLKKHFSLDALSMENISMDDESLENIYQRALALYNEDKAEQSSEAFAILIRERPFHKIFWLGLAASKQKLKEYEKALEAYALTSLIDDHDPMPHFHAAQCYIGLNNKDEAIKAINLAEALAYNDQKFRGCMDRIQTFKNNLRSI
jgi:type III secretion system low calcium response chaperone LcrH/SycD